jgi:hypothetical protein
MSPSNLVTYFSVLQYVTMLHNVLLGLLKAHSIQKGSVVMECSWNTHVTNTVAYVARSRYLTVELLLQHRNMRYVGVVNVKQTEWVARALYGHQPVKIATQRSSGDIVRESGRSQPRALEVLHGDQLHP